ncbi:MAG: DNA translocase FtsK 4TM domain-containing protein [Clostridia bacterium]|nr:DNA translocase FtsK 4TM domain-containing protein [Clostridia bacterium]
MAKTTNKDTAKQPAKKKRKKGSDRIRKDIAAIILIALGLMIGVGVFVDSGIAVQAMMGVVFGVFGLGGYVFPFLLIGVGVYILVRTKRRKNVWTVVFSLVLVFLVLNLISLITDTDTAEVTAWDFYLRAYNMGATERFGGGFVGALLPYALLLLFGVAGAYIFVCAAILIFIILLSRFSIGEAAQHAISGLKERGKRQGEPGEFDDDDCAQEADDEVLQGLLDSRKSRKKQGSLRDTRELDRNRRSVPDDKHIDETRSGPLYPDEENCPATDIRMAGGADGGADRRETSTLTYGAEAFEPEPAAEPAAAGAGLQEDFGAESAAPVPVYKRPPISLLRLPDTGYLSKGESVAERGKLLVSTLATFGISASVTAATVGSTVTRYEIQPAQGVRISSITALADDIALALAVSSVSIKPVSNKSTVGIEVPNNSATTVVLRDLLESREFSTARSPIAFALGKDITGAPVIGDLERMPHLLIAGATGAGKSVCVNDIILSFVYKSSPEDLRLILIDPKVVELSVYSSLPHLLRPVVTDPKQAAASLANVAREMDRRYGFIAKFGARDLNRFNALQTDPADRMPRIVVVIDELADLMIVAAKDVEDSINRIAAKGRACGIHLIVSTQSPRADIITGKIKANIPARIALQVASHIDSRVILDKNGAEKLLGRGDLYFRSNGYLNTYGQDLRCQAAYVSDEEIEAVTNFFVESGQVVEMDADKIDELESSAVADEAAQGRGKQEDELLPAAVRMCIEAGVASISLVQRKLRVGYARAARLIDIMEEHRYITGFEGSKARKVLITMEDYRNTFEADGSGDGA